MYICHSFIYTEVRRQALAIRPLVAALVRASRLALQIDSILLEPPRILIVQCTQQAGSDVKDQSRATRTLVDSSEYPCSKYNLVDDHRRSLSQSDHHHGSKFAHNDALQA